MSWKKESETDRIVLPKDLLGAHPLRVGISGASGTGKTFVMQAISERFGLPACPVGSRSVAEEMGLPSVYASDSRGSRAIFQRLLFERKRRWESEHDSFISDRTHADNLAYTAMHGALDLPENTMTEYGEAMLRYTHVFHFPVWIFQDLGKDPHRRPEKIYHELYDVVLEALLRKIRPSFRSITCLRDHRVKLIDDILRESLGMTFL